jgi:hypothetical protein
MHVVIFGKGRSHIQDSKRKVSNGDLGAETVFGVLWVDRFHCGELST